MANQYYAGGMTLGNLCYGLLLHLSMYILSWVLQNIIPTT
uniref:Uncharacterized protein n=1 Tax=Rhizophora mucronata TaxID=61149 RepID=A0A2P2R2C0_RHIMU